MAKSCDASQATNYRKSWANYTTAYTQLIDPDVNFTCVIKV